MWFRLDKEISEFQQEQIKLRILRALQEIFLILPQTGSGSEVLIGTYLIKGKSKKQYRVTIKSPLGLNNQCNCPDFARQKISTCKHIEAVRIYLSIQKSSEFYKEFSSLIKKPLVIKDFLPIPNLHLLLPENWSFRQREKWLLYIDSEGRIDPDEIPAFSLELKKNLRFGIEGQPEKEFLEIEPEASKLWQKILQDHEITENINKISENIKTGVKTFPELSLFAQIPAAYLYYQKRVLLIDPLGFDKAKIIANVANRLLSEKQIEYIFIFCDKKLSLEWYWKTSEVIKEKILNLSYAKKKLDLYYIKAKIFITDNIEHIIANSNLIKDFSKTLIVIDDLEFLLKNKNKIIKIYPNNFNRLWLIAEDQDNFNTTSLPYLAPLILNEPVYPLPLSILGTKASTQLQNSLKNFTVKLPAQLSGGSTAGIKGEKDLPWKAYFLEPSIPQKKVFSQPLTNLKKLVKRKNWSQELVNEIHLQLKKIFNLTGESQNFEDLKKEEERWRMMLEIFQKLQSSFKNFQIITSADECKIFQLKNFLKDYEFTKDIKINSIQNFSLDTITPESLYFFLTINATSSATASNIFSELKNKKIFSSALVFILFRRTIEELLFRILPAVLPLYFLPENLPWNITENNSLKKMIREETPPETENLKQIIQKLLPFMEEIAKGSPEIISKDIKPILPAVLPPEHIVFFDLETQKSFQELDSKNACGATAKRLDLLKVSVAVLYDNLSGKYLTFTENNIEELIKKLLAADLVVGFNLYGFDYPVLKAYTNVSLQDLPTCDILQHIKKELGFPISLDKIAKATLKVGKTGHGMQAIEWFREGKMQKLIDYCCQDVKITKDLYYFGCKYGFLYYYDTYLKKSVKIKASWSKKASN